VLQPLDRREGLDALRERLEPIDALLQESQVGGGKAGLSRFAKASLKTRLYDVRACDARDCDYQKGAHAAINHDSLPCISRR
jgi:hypothetical protein